jgi:hypothetical protein
VLDISGYYTLHRSCNEVLQTSIFPDENGDFGADGYSHLDGRPIHGHFDAATRAITFNDQQTPGTTMFVSFYSGFAVQNLGEPCFLAGTYHETVFTLTGSPPHPGSFTTVQSGWYAEYSGITE